jgi:hypothetical protein
MCRWQAVYLVYANAANAWINALTTREMYRLLLNSNQRRRYFPPTIRKVCQQSAVVYLYGLFISLWILVDGPWGLHDVDALYGFVCIPVQFSAGANLFWYLLFLPIFMGIPILYVIWIVYDIYAKKLLPPTGKRRELTIYFFRITFIFIFFWMPTVLVYYVFQGMHPWGMFALGVFTHSAGGVSAIFTTFKPDVGRATNNFLRCKWSRALPNAGEYDDFSSLLYGFSLGRRSSRRRRHTSSSISVDLSLADLSVVKEEEEDEDPTTLAERDVEQSVHELAEDEAKRSSTNVPTDAPTHASSADLSLANVDLYVVKEEEDQDSITMGEQDVEQSVHELAEDEAKRSSTDAPTDASRDSSCAGNNSTDDFALPPSEEEEEGRRSVRVDLVGRLHESWTECNE